MKTLSMVVATLAVSVAMANPPAAKPAAAQPMAPAATATQPADAAGTAHADKCAGKTGKELEACTKASAKKAH